MIKKGYEVNNKKNIISNISKIFVSYIIFIIFMNGELFLKKHLLGSDSKYIFFSISLAISIFIISLCIIFKKFLFKRKVNFWIIFLTLIIYNFSEVHFTDFYAYPFILLYVYLLTASFCIMVKSSKRFEIVVPATFSTLILFAFIFGLFGLLVIFKYFMAITFVLMIYYIIKKYKNDKKELNKSINDFFDSGFIVFNILWMLAILFGAGLYVHSYDEYSHWAYDARAMIYYSKFGTSQEIMLKTRAYPPIFTVWHYVVSIFNGFSEHNLYVGLNMLIMTYLLPAFYYLKNNNVLSKVLGFVGICFGCYIFGGVYEYSSLYADLAIATIFASTVIIYFISKDTNTFLNKSIILNLIILTLSKTNGFVIALIVMVIIFVNEITEKKHFSFKRFLLDTINFVKKYKYYILAIVLAFLIWRLYLIITGKITTDYYNFVLVPDGLKADLKYKLNYEFIINYFNKVYASLDSKFIGGIVDLSLYQFIIVNMVILFVVFYKLTGSIKKATLKVVPFLVSYVCFFVITLLSMFVALSVYEASNLASYARYLNWYNVAIVIFIVFLLLKLKNDNVLIKTVLLGSIIICIPFSSIFSFIKNPIKGESYNVSVERQEKVKLINKYTEKDSLVYIIDQKDETGIMAMWYSRYYAFPRKTNASAGAINWKIKTYKNKDDLRDWGLTAIKLGKHLNKYNFDYLFLYSKDDEFFKKTSFMFDDVQEAKKYDLFKIKKAGNTVKLIPIK